MNATEVQIQLTNALSEKENTILNAEAQQFLYELHDRFNDRRLALLEKRKERAKRIDDGELPTFLESTKRIRESDWTVAPLPKDLLDRRVEITGPVNRKMIINALNSGAQCFMADFEDSNSPTWQNCIDGQINLYDAIRRQIDFTNEQGKSYQLNDKTATLLVRPRGWHLEEKNIIINGQRSSGSLTDFGLYLFNNAQQLINNGSGPYFYLPKLESHLEARLWNDVFDFAQEYLEIPRGTIKATVLIETLNAAFEMDEILYELRAHSAGLNCGRWDYIFSVIKNLKNHKDFILPDRAKVTMTTPFMDAYSKLVIKTCHRRGVHAMGGMSAFIPIKNDAYANSEAIRKVVNDKTREVENGHDGSWVAHPGLIEPVREVFNVHMPKDNQIDKVPDINIDAEDLLKMPVLSISEVGLRENINVGILYIESWLRGIGAAALYNLMEDAATAEISRAQIWQWLHHKAKLDDTREIDRDVVKQIMKEEVGKIESMLAGVENNKVNQAAELFEELIFSEKLDDFLTLKAYELI